MASEDTVIQEDGFGFVPRNLRADESQKKPFTIVRRYTMTNKYEGTVRLISWGAGIQSIRIPNSQGIFGDVAFGFDDMEGYLRNRNIGRVINSVKDSFPHTKVKNYFDLESSNYPANGNFHDYDNVNWESHVSGQHVIMSYVSRAGVRERLGKMLIHVKYSWTDKNELNASILATTTESTPANFTIYCPMNLAGHATGADELRNHVVTINSDNHVPMNPGQRWFNETAKVDAHFYDLRNPTRLKNRLGKIAGGGYDHAMRISSPGNWCYRFHGSVVKGGNGRILHPESGRFVEVYSDKANSQFSTLNEFPDFSDRRKYSPILEDLKCRLAGGDFYSDEQKNPAEEIGMWDRPKVRGKDGALYGRHGGFVFSPRNHCTGRSVRSGCLLHPGEVFVHDMSFKFGVKSSHR